MSCRAYPLDHLQSLWRNGWVLSKKICKNLFPLPTLFQKKRLTTWSLKTLHKYAVQKKTFTMNYRGQSKRHPICRGKFLSAHQGGPGRRCYGATCLTWNRSIIGSAEALPVLCVRYFRWERERERDTERDRRKWRHHCRAKIGDEFTLSLPKIRTIGDDLTLFLSKNSHFSFLPSRRGHHCGAEIRNEFTLSIAKKFFALFVPPLSNGTSREMSDRKLKRNDQILPSPILFFPWEKMNQINTKNHWK